MNEGQEVGHSLEEGPWLRPPSAGSAISGLRRRGDVPAGATGVHPSTPISALGPSLPLAVDSGDASIP